MTNKQIVRRFSDELWGQGHLAVADDVLAMDLIEHNHFRAKVPDARVINRLSLCFVPLFLICR